VTFLESSSPLLAEISEKLKNTTIGGSWMPIYLDADLFV